ncbi:MAG: S8 family serine peptidase, partial [Hamadaea sp.]|nr:S8 family serine peptidase [Hamadaea sp.]
MSRYTAAKTSAMARTDRSLLGRSGGAQVSVVVKLANEPVATYRGGVPGFAATSPAVTGRPLWGGPAEQAYERFLAQQEDIFGKAAAHVPGVRLGQSLRTVYGGVALTVPANRVGDLLKIPGVVAVQRDEVRHPLTDSSPGFIGADTVQRALGGPADAGKGVIFGVLDTGAWPEHPSFADQGNLAAPPPREDGKARVCDFGVNPLTGVKFRCNHKLIGGRPFLDAYLKMHDKEKYRTARDSDGHGTHTASTSAGNVLSSAKVFGVDRGPLRGVAPGAWVSVYKVCGADGCFSSDSAAAVAQAVKDGVRVINFSIS